MSKVIQNDHLWTDAERRYVLSRSGGKELVAINEARYGKGGSRTEESKPKATKPVELAPDIIEKVRNLGADELKAALEQHDLSTEGSEAEAKKRLALHLQKERDA